MFNFRSGTELAVEQDQLIQIYRDKKSTSSYQLEGLEDNLWVMTASKMAPGNLVIRQWCLIDLFEGYPDHKDKIRDMVEVLSYGTGDLRLWAESYSYFCYTRDILDEWVNRFFTFSGTVKKLIASIDQGFLATSYLKYGVYYPAPYGDLRNEPLKAPLQITHTMKDVQVANVSMKIAGEYTTYTIKAKPVGLNTHVPKEDSNIGIIDGVPKGFHFYEGYDKKYKSSWEELKDTLSFKRIRSLF